MPKVTCPECRGRGEVPCPMEYGSSEHPESCPTCGGDSRVRVICLECDGDGKIDDERY